MKYLLLLTNAVEDIDSWARLTPEEAARLRETEIPRWNELFAYLGEQGVDASGLELDTPRAAKTVRLVDGEPLVTDGPYAETKEVVGGYLLVDCPDLDAALEVARRVPVVTSGSVEVRPLADPS